MLPIHPTAIIDRTAHVGENVEIGPYSIIGPRCTVGDGTKIDSHVVLKQDVTVGRDCKIAAGAILGGDPQDHNYKNEPSTVTVGARSIIRECVTINRGTGEGSVTRVGDDCMIMAYSHLAHNVQVGNHVILANAVQLAGYVEVGDNAFISSTCVFHQFCKIGRLAIVSGLSGSRQDIPPFSMSDGRPLVINGINRVGLKRAGFTIEQRNNMKQAFTMLFFSNLNQKDAVAAIREKIQGDPNVDELLEFVLTSKRGIHRATEEAIRTFQQSENKQETPVEV